MKKPLIFLRDLIWVSEETRREIVKKIITKAERRNISVKPVLEYQRLMRDIREELVNLSDEYEFISDGDQVDFSSNNNVMFTKKVLNRFIKEEGGLNIQRRNIDILYLYIDGEPYKQNNHNTAGKGGKEETGSNIRLPLIITGYIFLLAVITFFSFKYTEANKDLNAAAKSKKVLKENFNEKENRYKHALETFTKEFFQFNKYSELAYDSLKIPDSAVLLENNFNSNSVLPTKPNPEGIILKYTFREDTVRNYVFTSKPGIKECTYLNSGYGFGFGKTNCPGNCFRNINLSYDRQPNCTLLEIVFPKERYVGYLTFKWVEVGNNWGSGGYVYINKNKDHIGIDPYHYVGIFPPSRMQVNVEPRNFISKVDATVKTIDIAVWDISNESEIFINDIMVYGKETGNGLKAHNIN